MQVHINISDFVIGAMLLQVEDGCFHLITYHSHWLNASQLNYAIYEKETLAIISSLDQWSQYLQNGVHFMIITDYESIKYLDI